MKGFKNVCFGLLTSGTVAIASSAWTAQVYAQSNESAPATDTVIISEVPTMANWDYPAERGPWPEKLGLTDEQLVKLVSIKSDYAVNTAKQKAELETNKKKMIILMTEPKLDKAAILALNEKIDSLKTSLTDARVNQMLTVMNVMTPNQREQMRHHMLVHTLSHRHSMAGKGHKGSGQDHAV